MVINRHKNSAHVAWEVFPITASNTVLLDLYLSLMFN
jgi:hypothetical protein